MFLIHWSDPQMLNHSNAKIVHSKHEVEWNLSFVQCSTDLNLSGEVSISDAKLFVPEFSKVKRNFTGSWNRSWSKVNKGGEQEINYKGVENVVIELRRVWKQKKFSFSRERILIYKLELLKVFLSFFGSMTSIKSYFLTWKNRKSFDSNQN